MALAFLVLALPRTSYAAQYAAMKEVPVKGGQLRLAKPVSVQVSWADGNKRTEQLIAFPLTHTSVSVSVAGMMAQTTVTQTFSNPLKTPMEAVYLFPLGDEAAVSGYEIAIGERVIKGKIKTREAARRIYQRARSKGHTAALLQQEKANVFSQRIANIAPGETIRVRIQYVELLPYKDQRYELVIPMVVGPRYLPAENLGRRPVGSHAAGNPAPAGVASIPYVPPGTPGMPKIDITVRVDAGVVLDQVVSPSHKTTVKRVDATTATATLAAGDRIPNRDFIVRWKPRSTSTMVGLLAHRAKGGGYFVLMVQPKGSYRTGDIAPREVMLLVDVSGSMDGQPLAHAKAVAKGIVQHLSARDTFNVLSFASGVAQMNPKARRATAAGKAEGLRWIDNLKAGGGTELERAVVKMLARKPGADRIRLVYVLTDGYVGNDRVILATARRLLGHNRIFPVGVGSAPNRFLMNRLAEVGRGFPSYVTLRESPQKALNELVRRTTHPYLTDVKIHWGGLKVFDVVPNRTPDVYAGLPLIVAGRYLRPGTGTVRVTATTAGKRITVKLPVTLPAAQAQRPVAHLWARKRIQELMSMNYREIHAKTRQEVTRLGLEFGLVTDFTSYVAVDRTRVIKGHGHYRTVTQPAPTPEGVNFATAVQGAQSAPTPSGGSGYASSHGGGSSSSGGADLGETTWLLLLLVAGGWMPAIVFAIRRRRPKSPRS